MHAGHNVAQALDVAHIPDIELDLGGVLGVFCLQLVAHIILLFLVAAENANFPDVGGQEVLQNGMTKAARTAGDQKCLAFKNRVCHNGLLIIRRLPAQGAKHKYPL